MPKLLMDAPSISANMSLQATPGAWTLRSKSLSVFYGCPQMPRLSHYLMRVRSVRINVAA